MKPSDQDVENILKKINAKKFDSAKNLAIELTNKYPNYQFGWKILGVTYAQLGNFSQAIKAYQISLKLLPNDFETHYNLAITFSNLGKLYEASLSYKKAIYYKPQYFQALNNLGIILFKLKKFIEAKDFLKKAILLKENYLSFVNLGNIYKELNNYSKAIKNYQKALSLDPNNYESFYNLGLIYSSLGDKIKSTRNFEKAININNLHTDSHRQLSLIKKYTLNDDHFKKLKQIYKNKNISEIQKCQLSFALAKANEDICNFENSFELYCVGNKIRRSQLKYDIKQDILFFNNIKNSYLNIKNLNFSNLDKSQIVPIFIIGMPRSGTTLIEQIISSHSNVYGAGELTFIGDDAYTLSLEYTKKDKDVLINFRQNYLKKIKSLSKNYNYVSDKMPTNFQYLGLIKLAFPESKIIHVKRNSAATCWSIFKRYFISEKLGFCYDLDDIKNYYKLYLDLMNFWRKEIKNYDVYELNYDELTYNQEIEIKKLIKFLGLAWENDCLNPHLNNRAIDTASKLQVRKKIYSKSSMEWLKYKKFLGDVFDSI